MTPFAGADLGFGFGGRIGVVAIQPVLCLVIDFQTCQELLGHGFWRGRATWRAQAAFPRPVEGCVCANAPAAYSTTINASNFFMCLLFAAEL